MPEHGFLQDLVLLYAIAVALLIAAGKLRIPSIVALIAAGVIAGPSVAGVVRGKDEVDLLAEVGIALLLFMAGLDFSVAGLRQSWRGVLFGGGLQVALTGAVVAAAFTLARPVVPARLILLALFIALSSTAIVVRELTRRNQAHAPHGRLAIGVLLLQDLIVIAVIALTPVLASPAGAGHAGVLLLRLLAVLGGVFLIGRLGLPALLRVVSATGKEAFSVTVLLASIGTAWVTSALGLSMAVGAFLAGLVLAESEFSHQIYSEVRPVRDLLASLFFISVGLLVEPAAIVQVLPAVGALSVAIVGVKAITASAAFAIARVPLRVAVTAGLVLAHVGEFSLILGREGLKAGTISDAQWQVLLGAAILTMAVTPAMVGAAPGLGAWIARRSGAPATEPEARPARRGGHVVVLGFGAGGRLLAAALRHLATPYEILDLNGKAVRDGLVAGEPIHFADATSVEALEAAGVAEAAAVVAVMSDPDATERAIRAARTLNRAVPIIVRARYRVEAERLQVAGATLAVAEELEASLEVLSQLLSRLQMPGNVVDVLLDAYRDGALRDGGRPMRTRPVPLGELSSALSSVPVALHRLAESSWAAGRTLGEVDVRARTGATVMAVRRAGRTVASPGSEFRFEAGDDLYFLGDDVEIRLARARVEGGSMAESELRR